MNGSARSTFWFRSLLTAVGILAVTASNGCSCTRAGEPDPEPTGWHESEWSIVVDVGEGTALVRTRLAPAVEVSAPLEAEAVGADVPFGTFSTKGTIDTPSGGVTTPSDLNAAPPVGATAWALVYGAAAECGMVKAGGPPAGSSPITSQLAAVPPWLNRSFYIFENEPNNCEEVLAYEETLLCVADKLSEVSEALAPIRWNQVAAAPALPGMPKGPWTIPPQAAKDRFIARDLAINVLTHVSRVDSLILSPNVMFGACSRLFARAASDAAFASTNSTLIFGTRNYPPPTIDPTKNRERAEARLSFEAQILRGSARLLEDLVRRSVYADMAGAEQRSARALDANRGNKIAWGLSDNQNGPYNSYAHAMRVLSGRWEIGAFSPDPACGGVGNLELLQKVYGDDRAARDGDVELASAGQQYAARIVESSGIVFSETALEADGSEASLRAALRGQLLGTAAIARGLLPTDTASLGEQKTVIDRMVDQIKDGDLQFAMSRAARRYRLLTNTAEKTPLAATAGGLSAAPFAASAVTAAGGVVIDKGVSLGRIKGDAIARAGGIFEASQCNEQFGTTSQLGTDNWTGAYPTSVRPAFRVQRWVMQNVFDAGHALLRRLVVLREEAAGVGGVAPDGLVEKLARSAMTEVRSWAGSARVYAGSYRPPAGQIPGAFRVIVLGANPVDFGATKPEDLPSRFSIVYGPPWVAECAARLRDACPPEFTTTHMRRPTSSSVSNPPYKETAPPFARRTIGHTDAVVVLDFSLAASPGFDPKLVGSETLNEHLYLISDADPSSKDGRGMVLGTIALRTPGSGMSTGFPISPMHRELTNAILGLPSAGPPALGEPAPAKSPNYCIPGVPRDLFVPLENELTSDSDQYESSWKHYLTLAKAAAVRADDLGTKLIDVGLQRDFRREGAGEVLADICGEPAALAKLGFSEDGKAKPPKDGETIKQCLSEERIDVVFLGEDLIAPALPKRRTDLEAALKCATDGKNTALCKRLASGEPATNITTAGLRIAVQPKPEPTNACRNMVVGGQSLRSGFNDTTVAEGALKEPWAYHDRFASIAQQLSMAVDASGEWRVVYGGEVIMDTKDQPELWPGCLRGTVKCKFEPPTGGDYDKMASGFNQAFRGCATAAERATQTLGGCEGGSVFAEMTALRYRVGSALWTIGAIAGRVTPGMFRAQIPAVDFNLSGADWGGEPGAERSVPEILTLYPPGKFETTDPSTTPPALRKYKLQGDPLNAEELGPAFTVNAAFTVFPSASTEVPAWLRDLYAGT